MRNKSSTQIKPKDGEGDDDGNDVSSTLRPGSKTFAVKNTLFVRIKTKKEIFPISAIIEDNGTKFST